MEEHKNSHNSPYKFNGKELDEESGLYYYGARYYDPRISIWASVDPLVEQTMSAYGYCNLNPVNLIDPTGMSSEDPDDPGKKSWFGRAWDTVKSWFGGSKKSEKKCQVTVGPIQEVSNNKENIQKGQQIVLNVLAVMNGGSGKFDEAVSSAAEETKNVNTSVRWTSIAGNALMAEKFDTAGMLGSSIQYGWGNSLNKTANAAKTSTKLLPEAYSRFSRFEYHFGKHAGGFGAAGKVAYYKRALSLLNGPVGGNVQGFTNSAGYTFRMNMRTGEFGVMRPNGVVETFYRRLSDPAKYWAEQVAKWNK
ncbi:RHS repeat-associated core domain-containing protein [Flavobacterium branchiophilum]|uniref:RHS repeat-associated core domain-containing protein n=1 Tax=Flavobacterium branchiophilum TaxID=55197 RepID=UPI001CBEA4C1|nr:RHS repeat-associated core domain-containing protein [Flavobacterium branchiophilum]